MASSVGQVGSWKWPLTEHPPTGPPRAWEALLLGLSPTHVHIWIHFYGRALALTVGLNYVKKTTRLQASMYLTPSPCTLLLERRHSPAAQSYSRTTGTRLHLGSALTTVWLLDTLQLSFLTCEMGTVRESTSEGYCADHING